ncbi:MAG: hypothetical protein ACR2OM_08895, partial [Aestuariivirgaceae bacterium]
MELLIGLIVEFVIAIAIPVVAIFIDLIVSIVSLIAHVLFGYPAKKRSSKTQKPPSTKTPHPAVSKILLVCASLSGGLLVAASVAVVAANTFMFEPTVNWLAGKVSEKSGIGIEVGEADGSLLTGRLSLKRLRIERRNPSKTEYKLSVSRAEMDLDLLSFAFGTARFSMLSVEGVSGEIWSKPRPSDTSPSDRSKSQRQSPRKEFEIAQLGLSDVRISLHRPNSPSVSLAIDKLSSAPLRSQYAVFDTFFRSDVVASIDGHQVLISTDRKGDGRKTKWVIKDFPAGLVRHYVDKPPFSWFEHGTVDLMVEDDWSDASSPEIDMDWRLVLKSVKVAPPENTGLIGRTVSAPVAHYINRRDKDIDLRFRIVMNKDQFMHKSSLDATGIWNAVLDGTARAIADNSEAKADEVKEKIKNMVDRAKSYLDKKRQKAPNEEAGQ